jgi:protein-disulfide isomerase
VLGVAALAATLALGVGCGGGNAPAAVSPSGAGALAAKGPQPAENAPAGNATTPPPDLAAKRVELARVPPLPADAPSRGPVNAPVTLQVFSDFECPYCALAAPVVRELEAEFGGSLRIVWRNLPLPMHPHAALAAAAALEVYTERGGAAFWRFHDAAFAAQRSGLDEVVLERLARDEGVDAARYRTAIAGHVHDARIQADLDAGDAAGINGTPAFFVNSWFTVGALPYAELRAIVVQALRETGHAP